MYLSQQAVLKKARHYEKKITDNIKKKSSPCWTACSGVKIGCGGWHWGLQCKEN